MLKNEDNTSKSSSFKGYSLFTEPLEILVRDSNRGAIMANILEEHSQKGKLNRNGLSLLLGYFVAIPAFEREVAKAAFEKVIQERGYVYER